MMERLRQPLPQGAALLFIWTIILIQCQVHGLTIRPTQCHNDMGEVGTCMHVWECIKTEGKQIAVCKDSFFIGTCCTHRDLTNDIIPVPEAATTEKQKSSSSPTSVFNYSSTPRSTLKTSSTTPRNSYIRPTSKTSTTSKPLYDRHTFKPSSNTQKPVYIRPNTQPSSQNQKPAYIRPSLKPSPVKPLFTTPNPVKPLLTTSKTFYDRHTLKPSSTTQESVYIRPNTQRPSINEKPAYIRPTFKPSSILPVKPSSTPLNPVKPQSVTQKPGKPPSTTKKPTSVFQSIVPTPKPIDITVTSSTFNVNGPNHPDGINYVMRGKLLIAVPKKHGSHWPFSSPKPVYIKPTFKPASTQKPVKPLPTTQEPVKPISTQKPLKPVTSTHKPASTSIFSTIVQIPNPITVKSNIVNVIGPSHADGINYVMRGSLIIVAPKKNGSTSSTHNLNRPTSFQTSTKQPNFPMKTSTFPTWSRPSWKPSVRPSLGSTSSTHNSHHPTNFQSTSTEQPNFPIKLTTSTFPTWSQFSWIPSVRPSLGSNSSTSNSHHSTNFHPASTEQPNFPMKPSTSGYPTWSRPSWKPSVRPSLGSTSSTPNSHHSTNFQTASTEQPNFPTKPSTSGYPTWSRPSWKPSVRPSLGSTSSTPNSHHSTNFQITSTEQPNFPMKPSTSAYPTWSRPSWKPSVRPSLGSTTSTHNSYRPTGFQPVSTKQPNFPTKTSITYRPFTFYETTTFPTWSRPTWKPSTKRPHPAQTSSAQQSLPTALPILATDHPFNTSTTQFQKPSSTTTLANSGSVTVAVPQHSSETFPPVTTAKTTTPLPVTPCGMPITHHQKKVVGGKNSAFGSWPWQASVRRTSFFGFSSSHRCGGALISRQWVATAGHCVDDLLISQIKIRVGEYDFASTQEPHAFVERGVMQKVVHPRYNFFTYENDLALLKLEEAIDPIRHPHISPICLPPTDEYLVGKNATVTGWGRLSEGGHLPTILQEVQVPIISNEKCKNMFLAAGRHEYIPDIFMCAGFEEGGRDSCQGDSGGPLQIQSDEGYWYLAGIISWGIGCAEPNMPGVCTRISKFKDWIVEKINEPNY